MKKNILWVSILLMLAACQQETATQLSSAPDVESAPSVSVEAAATSEAAVEALSTMTQDAEMEAKQVATEVVSEAEEKMTSVVETMQVAKNDLVEEVTEKIAESKPEKLAMPDSGDEAKVAVMALAKKNNCFACHSVDNKIVGPAWKDVAAKYRGDAGGKAHLLDKITQGGTGVWGSMVMPPQPQLSEAERNTLVDYILSLK